MSLVRRVEQLRRDLALRKIQRQMLRRWAWQVRLSEWAWRILRSRGYKMTDVPQSEFDLALLGVIQWSRTLLPVSIVKCIRKEVAWTRV